MNFTFKANIQHDSTEFLGNHQIRTPVELYIQGICSRNLGFRVLGFRVMMMRRMMMMMRMRMRMMRVMRVVMMMML